MNYNERIRLVWICIIIAFVFIILGCISFLQKSMDANVALLSALWFLNMILLVIMTYQALLFHSDCKIVIFLIFFIALLFATLWVLQYNENIINANLSIVIAMIAILILIQFIPLTIFPLAVLSLLVWLITFFYLNHQLNKL